MLELHSKPSFKHGVMLSALLCIFMLSYAYQTVMSITSEPLVREVLATPAELGAIAGVFPFAFAFAQPVMGVALDRYGPKRTVSFAFIFAVVGSFITAAATSIFALLIGQCLIGVGCAPAFLAVMTLISDRLETKRSRVFCGILCATGGGGMLLTGTPLAWLIEHYSWRMGFYALGGLSLLCWLGIVFFGGSDPQRANNRSVTVFEALKQLAAVLQQPYAISIGCLAATSYGAFLSMRGLWLGPLFTYRHGFDLLQSGHVLVAMSIAAVVGAVVFGCIDYRARLRRTIIIGSSSLYAGLFVVHAIGTPVVAEIAFMVFNGFLAGFITLQCADVRAAYAPSMTGVAMSAFIIMMFLGAAVMQWLSGTVAMIAMDYGSDPVLAAMVSVSLALVVGTLAFWRLTVPERSNMQTR